MSIDSPHPACLATEDLLDQCDSRRLRRSGPGGQHRNKVETAVQLRHRPTGVEAEAAERRSQAENRRAAAFRLRVNLALAVRRPLPEAYRPGPLWRSRLQGSRISVNPEHDDFPALLAEALDVLAASDMDVKAAAERLGTTTSQLTRFLKLEPRALKQVNDRREELGLRRLK